MLKLKTITCFAFLALIATGCATAPRNLAWLPAQGLTVEDAHRDKNRCKQIAYSVAPTIGKNQAAYERCMLAQGHTMVEVQ